MAKNRNIFQFNDLEEQSSAPEADKFSRQKAYLLWLVLGSQPEFVHGHLKAIKPVFLRTLQNNLRPDCKSAEIIEQLNQIFINDLSNLGDEKRIQTFFNNLLSHFQLELDYLNRVYERNLLEILFQMKTLAGFEDESSNMETETRQISEMLKKRKYNENEIDSILKQYSAYKKIYDYIANIVKKISESHNLDKVAQAKDQILQKVKIVLPKMTYASLDNMFCNIYAQFTLVKSNSDCAALLFEWAVNDKLDLKEMERVAENYIPFSTSFLQLPLKHAECVKKLKEKYKAASVSEQNFIKNDIFLLGQLLLFYNSFIERAREKMKF